MTTLVINRFYFHKFSFIFSLVLCYSSEGMVAHRFQNRKLGNDHLTYYFVLFSIKTININTLETNPILISNPNLLINTICQLLVGPLKCLVVSIFHIEYKTQSWHSHNLMGNIIWWLPTIQVWKIREMLWQQSNSEVTYASQIYSLIKLRPIQIFTFIKGQMNVL